MFKRKRIALASLAMLATGLAVAIAQAAKNESTNNSATATTATSATAEKMLGNRPDVDLFLIPCLIDANQAEVALGTLAEQRAQSGEVKSFAQEMVKDHTVLENQARQLQATLTKQMHPQNPGKTPVAATLFEIHTKIAQACLASAERGLEKQSAADFDRVYIGMQVGAHQRVADTLAVFKEYAQSPQLKQAIADASQIVNQHLERAQKLWKDVEQPQQPHQASQRTQQRR